MLKARALEGRKKLREEILKENVISTEVPKGRLESLPEVAIGKLNAKQ
jgi:hypothetical protein